jgi:hypothetical protein
MRDLKNVTDLAKVTEPTIFDDSQLAVIAELIKYNDYYNNESFKYIADEYPEFRHGRVDGKDYRPAQVPLNYGKLIIDKLAAWQFEESIDFSVTSEVSQNRADEIETDLYEIHKLNKMDIKLLQAAQESNISGGITFKLKWDDKKNYPRILIRNRIETFVVTEFDDYEEIIRIHFIAFSDDKTIWKQTFEMVNGICYISEAEYDVQNIKVPKRVIIEYQPLGNNGNWLDFLPVYVVANMAQLGEIWGYSELRDLIPIIDEINKKYSDLSDSLKFDMFAITVFLNAKIPTGADGKLQLRNKAGAAWNIMGVSPTDNIKPEVFKLQGTFNYVETLKYHINTLVSCLFEFSEAVNISPEKVTGLPALSGIALKLLFASIISKTNRKNTVWKAKLAEVYMGALKLKQIYDGYDIPDDLDIEIITHIPMPQNELEELEVISAKLADSLISVTTAMNEIGVEDPEAEVAKILEEKNAYDKALNTDRFNNTDTDNEDGK